MEKKNTALFLTTVLPYTMNNGGKIKTIGTLDVLSKIYNVEVMCFRDIEENNNKSGNYKIRYLEDMHIVSNTNKILSFSKLCWSWLKLIPYIIGKYYSRSFQIEVDKAIRELRPDIIYIDHLPMVQYVINSGFNFVLDQHNFETGLLLRRYSSELNIFKKFVWKFESSLLKKYEKNACDSAQLLFAISNKDSLDFKAKLGVKTPIHIQPIIIKEQWPRYQMPKENRILLIGNLNWGENFQGVMWFLETVFPLINKRIIVRIAGKGALTRLNKYRNNDRIELVDDFEDIKDVIKDSKFLCVPLLSGSGIRIKVIQALKAGMPLVSTSIGCEGVEGIENKRQLFISENSTEFALTINNLIEDQVLLNRLSERAFEWGKTNYNNEQLKESLKNLKYL